MSRTEPVVHSELRKMRMIKGRMQANLTRLNKTIADYDAATARNKDFLSDKDREEAKKRDDQFQKLQFRERAATMAQYLSQINHAHQKLQQEFETVKTVSNGGASNPHSADHDVYVANMRTMSILTPLQKEATPRHSALQQVLREPSYEAKRPTPAHVSAVIAPPKIKSKPKPKPQAKPKLKRKRSIVVPEVPEKEKEVTEDEFDKMLMDALDSDFKRGTLF